MPSARKISPLFKYDPYEKVRTHHAEIMSRQPRSASAKTSARANARTPLGQTRIARSLADHTGNGVNRDVVLKQPNQRPEREHWGPKVNKALDNEIEKPKRNTKPAPAPTPGKGKGAAAKIAAFISAMTEMFPPPANSGLRPVYISSMSIGGKRLEPD